MRENSEVNCEGWFYKDEETGEGQMVSEKDSEERQTGG